MSKEINRAEVKKHEKDVWLIINNNVYDVKSFLQDHPGGADALLDYAGKDATQAFEDVGHSSDARSMMEKYQIGTLPEKDKTSASESQSTYSPETLKSDKPNQKSKPKEISKFEGFSKAEEISESKELSKPKEVLLPKEISEPIDISEPKEITKPESKTSICSSPETCPLIASKSKKDTDPDATPPPTSRAGSREMSVPSPIPDRSAPSSVRSKASDKSMSSKQSDKSLNSKQSDKSSNKPDSSRGSANSLFDPARERLHESIYCFHPAKSKDSIITPYGADGDEQSDSASGWMKWALVAAGLAAMFGLAYGKLKS